MDIPEAWLGRRAALKAAAIAIAIVVLLLGIPTIAAFWALHSETNAALTQLALYRAEMGLKPALESELADLRLRASNGTGLIVADDSAQAEAQIQREMKSIIENNVGEVRSSQVSSKKPAGGLEEIAVQYSLSVPITRLNPLLYAIETHTPYLFVDAITISGTPAWQQPIAQSGRKQPEAKLEVRLTVRAYRWSAK